MRHEIMEIAIELQNKIVNFFKSLPNIDDVTGRQALIVSVGLDPQIRDQISFNEPLAQFVPLLVSKLLKYGTLNDGRNALEATLEATKAYIGHDRRVDCDSLLQELQAVTRKPSQALKSLVDASVFQINNEFKDNLSAIGASFTHPHKSEIFLEDLFVYPDLKDIDIDAAKSEEENPALNNILNSSVLLNLGDSDNNKFLIVGDDKSGTDT